MEEIGIVKRFNFKRLYIFGFVLLCVAILGGVIFQQVGAFGFARPASQRDSLSSYWHPHIQRWQGMIMEIANLRGLDPDFLASLIWMESSGQAEVISPAGAVGLMQVMSKEAGFSWRPAEAELLNPYTNLAWGSNTLLTVIHQGRGDVFNALAAYNGGWEKTDHSGPQYLATRVLRDYSNSVATRHALGENWVAFFAVQDFSIHGPIRVAESLRDDVYFYGADNYNLEGAALIPDVPPTSVVARCLDEDSGVYYNVGIWLYDTLNQRWVSGDAIVEEVAVVSAAVVAPAPVNVEAAPEAPAVVETPPPAVEPTPVPEVAAEAPSAEPEPVVVPQDCAGGPLTVDAWPVNVVNTVEDNGWTVTIFAEGHGGNCVYTYAWNEETEVQGAALTGGMTFDVHSTRRDSVIVGTVVVTSGEETVRVGVYVNPPGSN